MATKLLPSAPQRMIALRMNAVREAFRLRRLAREQRCLWLFYQEHSLFDEAKSSRLLMIDCLRNACQQWRLTLGIAQSGTSV